ncbi:hypothetical protein SmJEL517_g03255 [Synchytrium microbalum]|uniref:Amidohydrolase 3 domain-containing protein n=1 Tax=Synchytrium microbalum TaxID=1806994 RepID=A0A507C2Z9_9FUNG|nr:uncharacterized protein SmJEL517_g03255 [Synchytrium microbalum]TPX34072.1 hypothetical protein SmJEL517_g03255 [Synchytrium microbalum]
MTELRQRRANEAESVRLPSRQTQPPTAAALLQSPYVKDYTQSELFWVSYYSFTSKQKREDISCIFPSKFCNAQIKHILPLERQERDAIALLRTKAVPRPARGYYAVKNAVIYTMNDSQPVVSSFIVQDGRFTAVGETEDILIDHPHAKLFDLAGRMITPGLIDAHGHLILLGNTLIQADLTGSSGLEDVRSRLKAHLEQNPSSSWLIGRGWDQTTWPGSQFPTAADLDVDPILACVPIALFRVDYHAYWVNQAAIKLLKLPSNLTIPGGEIRMNADGTPSGIFIDDAMTYVETARPKYTDAETNESFDKAMEVLPSYGITGIHDAGVRADELSLFLRILKSTPARFKVRNYVMFACDGIKYCGQGLRHSHKSFMTVRSVKIFLDGALGSWGAAMVDPYTDKPDSTGFLRIEPEELESLVWQWMIGGWQVNIHAIGDKGTNVALNAFEYAIKRYDELETPIKRKIGFMSGREFRHRVEHAQILRPDDVSRFAELGVLPSMQPTHATSDMYYVEKRIGRRAAYSYLWKTFINHSVPLPLSSDFPVESPNPLLGLYAAVTRLTPAGKSPHGDKEGWFPKERLSIEEALKGFTLNAAYAAHQESEVGSIEVGKFADFTVFDTDFVQATKDGNASSILNAGVNATVVGGQVTFGDLGEGVGGTILHSIRAINLISLEIHNNRAFVKDT